VPQTHDRTTELGKLKNMLSPLNKNILSVLSAKLGKFHRLFIGTFLSYLRIKTDSDIGPGRGTGRGVC
jgi:hypothetical protein